MPAHAGIQMIKKFPRKWGNSVALSALQRLYKIAYER